MRRSLTFLFTMTFAAFAADAKADVIDGMNWADGVAAYSSNIQNYGGVRMSDPTAFWVTGSPDADANGDGDVLDGVDRDYVAGWRGADANEYIAVYFSAGLMNLPGDDLSIWCYGGSSASCTVWAGADDSAYTEIGTIGGGTTGWLDCVTFDFDGLVNGNVHYVKVLRTNKGSGTGMFFDAFGGATAPEPGTMTLLAAAGAIGAFRCASRKWTRRKALP